MRLRVLAGVALLVLASCSGESESAAPTTTAGQAVTSTTAPGSTLPPVTTTQPPATTTTSAAAAVAPPVLAALSGASPTAAAIELTVAGTARPSISWAAADGADRYMAIVVDDSGTVLWAWAGEATAVTVGAGAVDRPGAGARLGRPGWLQVIGFGSDGITAVSETVPVG